MLNRTKSFREKVDLDKGFPNLLSSISRYPCGKTIEKRGAEQGGSSQRVTPVWIVCGFIALMVLLGVGPIGADQGMTNPFKDVTSKDLVKDVIEHPAFKGFGRLLFPWDDREYDPNLTMQQVRFLLPFHTHVHVGIVIESLNRMIADVRAGNSVFYRFYTARDMQEDPSKHHSGLFFFRGNPRAPFAVVCPGGGFLYVGSLHEGFPYAHAISRKGYNAFVLKYRTGSERKATEDLAAALSYIIRNSEAFSVARDSYSLWGSSAGARMVANIGTRGVQYFGGDPIHKPATIVMAYTGHTEYSAQDPPTFAVVGENDRIAYPVTMEGRIRGMQEIGIDATLRIYPGLGHGFGLGIGTPAEGWIEEAIRFWETHMTGTLRPGK
ncbi:MAG: alpha/beta hydrolase [Spirochaetes bacterium]|nr:alpha/beta hydrolase [Spirochaetota bacterium]